MLRKKEIDLFGDKSAATNNPQVTNTTRSPRLNVIAGGVLPAAERLHHLFESCCDRYSSRIAIINGGEHVTYAELDQSANQLARYLIKIGLRPGARVGIHLDRSANVYISLLAVLKAHAVFVPMDPELPTERKLFIADDAGLSAIITTSVGMAEMGPVACRQIALDLVQAELADMETERPCISPDTAAGDDSLCYIMYTSGSTGTPKGVAVEHASICHFVRVARYTYGIMPADRVYQGMIIAFDFSIEEIWPALTCGAAIVPASAQESRLGDELADFLNEYGVTVLCCVPTLLATLTRDVPSLRLLMVGGEPCPQYLVEKWGKQGCRMLNTYGPTETTVTATWGELLPGKPVTIGRAMPGYTVYLLDEDRNPVAVGQTGEICIAGIGVARGYVNRPKLTRQSFIPDKFDPEHNPSGRLYCTGDLGRLTPAGEIEYLGRVDSQVKIRGRRVELSEIEAVLAEHAEVYTAVVSTTLETDIQEIVAYCQLIHEPLAETKEQIRQWLAARLPSYMVPAYIEIMPEIPVLPNGKVDRKQLPAPRSPRLLDAGRELIAPKGPCETEIARHVAQAFGLENVSVEDDFFDDLGGHSLIVAKMVSAMRKVPMLAGLGLRDIYECPTVRRLAAVVVSRRDDIRERNTDAANTASPREYASDRKVWLCGIAQVSSLFSLGGLMSLLWLSLFNPLLARMDWARPDLTLTIEIFGLTLLFSIAMAFTLPVVVKWTLLGRIKPGEYRLWGWFFLRWWLVQKVSAIAPTSLLACTPMLNGYYRLMGARIGKDCVIETNELHVVDLIEIDDSTSIGVNTHVFAYSVENGKLLLAPVRIGRACYIGTNSVLMPGATMEDEAWLGDQSFLARQETVPRKERWSGSPAAPDQESDEVVERLAAKRGRTLTPLSRLCRGAGFVAAMFITLLVPVVSALPGILLMLSVYRSAHGSVFLLTAPLAGISFILILNLSIVVLKRIVLPRIRPGVYPVNSSLYVRKYLVDRLMETSLSLTNSLYATLYLPPLLRLLGARIGKRAEISTISHIMPGLLTIDDESFVADMASVGPSRTYNNRFAVGETRIGTRAFVGNAALVRDGVSISDHSLVGVLSAAPQSGIRPGSIWLGSPAIKLPRREQSRAFPDELTYRPGPELYRKRLTYEFFRVTLPAAMFTAAAALTIGLFARVYQDISIFSASMLLPILALAMSTLLLLVVVGFKKILIGTYRSKVCPMWSTFVWRTELITALYENVAVPLLIGPMTGTPFAPVLLRLFGARIGRRCYLETTYLTEFDLVSIGDDTVIGANCSLQTHLFEDRVMKMSALHVGSGCSIGPRAIVLYDARLEDGIRFDGLSLAMKGETLSGRCTWRGVPARRVIQSTAE